MCYLKSVTIASNYIITTIIFRMNGYILKIYGYIIEDTRIKQPMLTGNWKVTSIEGMRLVAIARIRKSRWSEQWEGPLLSKLRAPSGRVALLKAKITLAFVFHRTRLRSKLGIRSVTLKVVIAIRCLRLGRIRARMSLTWTNRFSWTIGNIGSDKQVISGRNRALDKVIVFNQFFK